MKTQMKLVAAATLSLAAAGAVVAQENTVSLYGRANLSVENQKVGNRSESALVDNQSRLGVRANRALGNGLSAGLVLEAGVNFNNGVTNSGTFFAREATANIGSDAMGRVKLGRMAASTAYFATADYVSNHNHDTGSSADALYDGPATGKLKNAIAYTAPKIGNLVIEGQYGLKNGVGISNDPNVVADSTVVNPAAFSASYGMGPLALALGYERGENTATALATDYANATTLRALYTMGPLGFGGYMQKSSGTNFDRTAYRLSAMYAVGKNEYHVNYGSAGNRGNVANSGATQFTLAYNYNLDKQTKVYALATRVSNDSGAKYSPGRYIASPTNGQELSSVGVGMRYNF